MATGTESAIAFARQVWGALGPLLRHLAGRFSVATPGSNWPFRDLSSGQYGVQQRTCAHRDEHNNPSSGTGTGATARLDLAQGSSQSKSQGSLDALYTRLLLIHAQPTAVQKSSLLVVSFASYLENHGPVR